MTHAFPREDQASDLCDLDFSLDTVPVGVQWDISADTFTFKVSQVKRPFTSRGMLPVLNSQYDPLGLAVPVIVREKFLLRSMMANVSNIQPKSWDRPLAEEQKPTWEACCKALQALMLLMVPCYYTMASSTAVRRREVLTFCDASNDAIRVVSYLRAVQDDGSIQVSFVFGKAKLAPSHATTIPRLELCAATHGIEITELIHQE